MLLRETSLDESRLRRLFPPLAYYSWCAATLIAAARRLLLDPLEIGPIRLVGVGFSGLSEIRQEPLFPDLDAWAEPTDTQSAATPTVTTSG